MIKSGVCYDINENFLVKIFEIVTIFGYLEIILVHIELDPCTFFFLVKQKLISSTVPIAEKKAHRMDTVSTF